MAPYPIHQQGPLLAVYYRKWLAPGVDFEPIDGMNSANGFRALRLELGLTQAELGMRLGLNERQIRRLESGETPIKPHHLLAIESLLSRQHDRIRNAAAAMAIAGLKDE